MLLRAFVAALALLLAAAHLATAQDVPAAGVVRAYYEALQAGDFEKAAGYLAGPGRRLEGAREMERLAASEDLFGSLGLMAGMMEQTPVERCQGNLKNIGTALEMYSTDNVGRFPRGLSSLTPDYLIRLPSCPTAKKDTYSESYRSTSDPDLYSFYCSGDNHASEGYTADHPQYNAVEGLVSGPVTEPSPAAEKKRPGLWTLVEVKVGDARVDGNRGLVSVTETYSVFGFRTTVGAELPLVKQGDAWRIDTAALPPAPRLDGGRDTAGEVLQWVKSRGYGVTAGVAYRQAASTEAK